ncbi:Sporulation related domain-containing protein [Lutibacter oricola]|uniref:Sporulation related domain-containing protein n=1 Tax=Lutibacter oricola TaxID=762486 RepID=A0A1H3DBW0_9FLAO|nr:SPOR domain-containing protein [Lutibacter oricola]SDX63881.1 Sporulation related domain-containing protein [Lutibacter oricola]
MTLANYISDLLYRYECVIIPNFGGFVTKEISAKVNNYTHTFYAPSKELSFNAHLQNNDGLLANYIATAQNISYEKALNYINQQINDWKCTLAYDELQIEKIGSLTLNKEGKLLFEPDTTVNYLTSSFGLSSYVSPAVKRITYKEQVRKLETVAPILPSEENKRRTPAFIKYAATAAIIFALGSVGWNQFQKFEHNNLVAKAEIEQQQVDKKIQEATFIIENPLPAITLNVTKETKNFHVVAGAFREAENAEKKLQELISKGYSAKILGLNKWNLTQVAYASFNSRNEAINQLNAIKKSESKDAWLLVKEY